MNTELSDEQLGRLWCERNGKRPCHDPGFVTLPWHWVYDDGPFYALPLMMIAHMPRRFACSEADAYAAVGAALRELHRRAGEIAAVLGGVL